MHIAVVDDEREMRTQLETYIRRFSEETENPLAIHLFSSADALLENYQSEFDIIIFDIDMPGTNGMDAARRIRETDSRVTILFVTNMAQYAINGYEVEAVDYIIKPIGYYDFSLKFQKALRRTDHSSRKVLLLDTTGGQVAVDVNDILFVEAKGHYLLYKTAKADLLVRGSLSEHEKSLKPYHFERVQKSFLVNLARIENIKTAELIVGGIPIPTGKLYREALMKAYMRYIKG